MNNNAEGFPLMYFDKNVYMMKRKNLFCSLVQYMSCLFKIWKRLLAGTLPDNNLLLAGRVPDNNSLLSGRVPDNNSLLSGTPILKHIMFGVIEKVRGSSFRIYHLFRYIFQFKIRKRLLAGTLPDNNLLLAGRVPDNSRYPYRPHSEP